MKVIEASAKWAAENLEKKDRFYIEPMDKTDGLILADGNTAAALGAIYGGVQIVGWYPITPATSLVEKMNYYLPKLRTNKEAKQLTPLSKPKTNSPRWGLRLRRMVWHAP